MPKLQPSLLPSSVLQRTASSAPFTSSAMTLRATPDRRQRKAKTRPMFSEILNLPIPIINAALLAEYKTIIMKHGATKPTLPSVVKYPRRFPAPSQYLQTSIGLSTTKIVSAGFYQAKRVPVKKTKDMPRPSLPTIVERIFYKGNFQVAISTSIQI